MSLLNRLLKNVIPASADSLIKQTQPGGDALACIAMVLNSHNITVDLGELEKKYPEFQKGMNLKSMMDIFEDHKLYTKALQCPISDLASLELPVILHWDMKQFVVLSAIDNGVYIILDPASKRLKISKDVLEQHFAEIVLAVNVQ